MTDSVAQQFVNVAADGRVSFVWNDGLAGLRHLGPIHVRRASHVEPTDDGRWTADLSPVGGPLLGPFALRGTALAAERAWLDAYPDRWAD